MEFSRTFTTIDAHTAGEPLRLVTAGLPTLKGTTILERRRYAKEHLDFIRRLLMFEPRGHADMYGAYLTPPVTPDADYGVIFTHNEGYSDMCGHGIIAVATILVTTGMLERHSPETHVGLDSPAGFIEAWVEWDGRKVGQVRFKNVPSFLFKRDLEIETPSFGKLNVDIAFGGAFYAYLDAAQTKLEVHPEHYQKLIQLGDEVKQAVMKVCPVQHPLEPELSTLYGTIIDGKPFSSNAGQSNVCVFADREVDRSPTGTGTAGRVAQLVARGKLALGETLVNQSIIGMPFYGKALEHVKVGAFNAVIPEVAGCASLTGFHTFVLEPDDALQNGFLLR